MLMARAEVPALMLKSLVASTLLVLLKVPLTPKLRCSADCKMPLLFSVANVNVPDCPAVLEAVKMPALLRSLAVNVVPVVPCTVPLAWLVKLAALTIKLPSAINLPLLVTFCVMPLALSAISNVVLACKVPLLLTTPLRRAVMLPASAVMAPVLASPLPAVRRS